LKTRQVSEFKETEFGKVPVDWEVTELENICERVSVGHVGLTSKFFCGKEEGVLFLRSQNVRPGRINLTDLKYVTYNFHETHKKSQLHEGDLMIVRVGSNRGDCCVVPKGFDKLNCANIVFARPKSEFSSFLGHYFRSHLGKQKLDSISTGSAQGVINTKHIAKLLIPLPLPHQALAISHLLDTLDFKIQNLQNQNKTLEQIAQAIFKSWFVDFDGVTEFEDSELGNIPKGWSVEKLHDVCTLIQNGGTPKRTESTFWNNGTVNWYKTGELRDNFLLDSKEKITESGLKNSSAYLLPENTILFAIYAFPVVGRMGILTKQGCSNQAASGLIPKKEIGTYFLFLSLMFSRDFLGRIATGAAQQNISKAILQNHLIILPHLNLISKFNKKIEAIFEQIKNIQIQTNTLIKTRDALLPKLMSGEIRV